MQHLWAAWALCLWVPWGEVYKPVKYIALLDENKTENLHCLSSSTLFHCVSFCIKLNLGPCFCRLHRVSGTVSLRNIFTARMWLTVVDSVYIHSGRNFARKPHLTPSPPKLLADLSSPYLEWAGLSPSQIRSASDICVRTLPQFPLHASSAGAGGSESGTHCKWGKHQGGRKPKLSKQQHLFVILPGAVAEITTSTCFNASVSSPNVPEK